MATKTTYAEFKAVALGIALVVFTLLAFHTPAIDTLMTSTLASAACIDRFAKINGMDALRIERRTVLGHVVGVTTFCEVNPNLRMTLGTTGFIVKWMTLTLSHSFCLLSGKRSDAIDEHASRAGLPVVRECSSSRTNTEERMHPSHLPGLESERTTHYFRCERIHRLSRNSCGARPFEMPKTYRAFCRCNRRILDLVVV